MREHVFLIYVHSPTHEGRWLILIVHQLQVACNEAQATWPAYSAGSFLCVIALPAGESASGAASNTGE
jgi:hypothetical protein